jgi:hypothetical protein
VETPNKERADDIENRSIWEGPAEKEEKRLRQ